MPPLDRQQIADLESQLAKLALRFAAAGEAAPRRTVAQRYAEVLDALYAIPDWWGEPAPDAQLPDAWMPESYKQFWSQPPQQIEARLANYRLSGRLAPDEFRLPQEKAAVEKDNPTFSLDDLMAARRFAKRSGGVEMALALIDAFNRVRPKRAQAELVSTEAI